VIDWLLKNLDNPKLFVTENGIYEEPNKDESEKKIKYHRVSYTYSSSAALYCNKYKLFMILF